MRKRIEINGYFGPSYPAIIDNGKSVVIMYNSGNPFTGGFTEAGRPIIRVRLSKDNGQTWEEATNPFPMLQGNSGDHALVMDSNHVVQAIFIMRIEGYLNGKQTLIGGVWHSELRGGSWTNPDRFTTSLPPANLRAVVSQGNLLLVTWREDPGSGNDGVWYSYITLTAPELPLKTLPILQTINPPSIGSTAIPVMSILSTPIPISMEIDPLQDLPGGSYAPTTPLIFGMVAVILILLGVILVKRLYRPHKF